jgi:hypothetical protein
MKDIIALFRLLNILWQSINESKFEENERYGMNQIRQDPVTPTNLNEKNWLFSYSRSSLLWPKAPAKESQQSSNAKLTLPKVSMNTPTFRPTRTANT